MNDRLRELVNGWLDQSLTATEQAELETCLLESEEPRRQFWRMAALHGLALEAIRLKWTQFDPSVVGQPLDELPTAEDAPGSPAAGSETSRSPILGFLGGACSALAGSPRTVVLLLGGALAGYFLIVFALIPLARFAELTRLAGPEQGINGHRPALGEAVVGTLTFDASAKWASNVRVDSKARRGVRYALQSGRVSVALERGARLVIEGPAEWHFDSDAKLQFDTGQLAAYVPPQAVGFVVTTPAAEVLDLGTEFDLAVGPDGETEVYVVTGKVALKRIADGQPSPAGVRVAAGDAVRVSAPGGVQSIPFDKTGLSSTRTALNTALRLEGAEGRPFPAEQPILLSNLFDDRPHTTLTEAMRSDTFGAEADLNDLGIDRVVSGGGPVQTIGPTLQFDLTNLGWQAFGWPSIANDSGTIDPKSRAPSGMRVSGMPMNKDLPRIDDGFCQTGNARITFNLDDLRAAGRLQGQSFEFICDRAGICDQWVPDGLSSMHMIVVVSTDTQISAALVDGKPVEVVERDGRWSVDSPIGEPLRGTGPIVSFRAEIGLKDKYLTLAATSAGDGYADDQAAWIAPRLIVKKINQINQGPGNK